MIFEASKSQRSRFNFHWPSSKIKKLPGVNLGISFRHYFYDLALKSFEHANFLSKFFHRKRFERKRTLNSDFLPLDPRAVKKDNSIIWSEFLFKCSFPTQKILTVCHKKETKKNLTASINLPVHQFERLQLMWQKTDFQWKWTAQRFQWDEDTFEESSL